MGQAGTIQREDEMIPVRVWVTDGNDLMFSSWSAAREFISSEDTSIHLTAEGLKGTHLLGPEYHETFAKAVRTNIMDLLGNPFG